MFYSDLRLVFFVKQIGRRRNAYETAIAELEGGCWATATASGLGVQDLDDLFQCFTLFLRPNKHTNSSGKRPQTVCVGGDPEGRHVCWGTGGGEKRRETVGKTKGRFDRATGTWRSGQNRRPKKSSSAFFFLFATGVRPAGQVQGWAQSQRRRQRDWPTYRLNRPPAKREDLGKTLFHDSLTGHSCRTLFLDTLVWHSCRTRVHDTLAGGSNLALLWDTLTGHSCGTPWLDTLARYSDWALLWDALTWHSCKTLLPDTLVDTLTWHSCRTLVQDTLAGDSYLALLWDTLTWRSCRTLGHETLTWHSCKILLRGIPVGHSDLTLL